MRHLLVLLALAPLQLQAATLTYSSQSRSAIAKTIGNSGTTIETLTAPDAGPINLSAHVEEPDHTGFATQNYSSTLGGSGFTFSGAFTGQFPTFAGSGVAQGEVITDLVFHVDEITAFHLEARALDGLDAAVSPFLSRLITLDGPGVSVSWALWYRTGLRDYAIDGMLQPGSDYHLAVDLRSSIGYGSSVYRLGGFTAGFSVPEPNGLCFLAILWLIHAITGGRIFYRKHGSSS